MEGKGFNVLDECAAECLHTSVSSGRTAHFFSLSWRFTIAYSQGMPTNMNKNGTVAIKDFSGTNDIYWGI